MYKLAALTAAVAANQIKTEEDLRVFALNKYSFDKYSLIMFAEGLVYGALGVQEMNMASCVEDGMYEIKEAEKALEDIKSLDAKDVAGDFLQMFAVFGQMKAKCPLILTDKAIYENGVLAWIELQLKDPHAFEIKIAEDIVSNKGDIVDKAKNTLVQYKKGDWWMVGYDLGAIVSDTVVGEPTPVAPEAPVLDEVPVPVAPASGTVEAMQIK